MKSPLVLVAAVLALANFACADDSSSDSANAETSLAQVAPEESDLSGSKTSVEPVEASTVQIPLVDTSRPTPATAESEELPERTLQTWLYLPASNEPAPLIIFAHGIIGHPTKFERMHTAWRDAGYAVAAPAFPLTNDRAPSGGLDAADVVNQPGDVIFVLDQLLDLNEDQNSDLYGRFDREQLGAAGLSLGGLTTYSAAVDEATRDDRFKAVIIQASVIPNSGLVAPTDLPILVMHGSTDPVVDPATALAFYESLNPPKIFVSLLEGWHADPFEDPDLALTERAVEFHPLVDETTTLFWDTYLRSDPTANGQEVVDAATDERLTVVESDLG